MRGLSRIYRSSSQLTNPFLKEGRYTRKVAASIRKRKKRTPEHCLRLFILPWPEQRGIDPFEPLKAVDNDACQCLPAVNHAAPKPDRGRCPGIPHGDRYIP